MNTKVYIKAARLIDSGEEEFSCNAIVIILGDPAREEKLYYELFVTDRYDRKAWATFNCLYKKIYGEPATDEQLKEIRVLALLFAAEYFADFDN